MGHREPRSQSAGSDPLAHTAMPVHRWRCITFRLRVWYLPLRIDTRSAPGLDDSPLARQYPPSSTPPRLACSSPRHPATRPDLPSLCAGARCRG